MILTRIVTWLFLVPLYVVFLVLGYWLYFEPKVESDVRFWVSLQPTHASPGEILTVNKTLTKAFPPLVSSCPTSSVHYYLVRDGEDAQTWILRASGGLQRGEGKQTYVSSLKWPISAEPGTYRGKIVVKYRCNPVTNNVNIAFTAPFVVQ